MVKLRAVAITLLTTATFYDRIQNELKRNFNADDIHRMLYIRCASLVILPYMHVVIYLLITCVSTTESLLCATTEVTHSTTVYWRTHSPRLSRGSHMITLWHASTLAWSSSPSAHRTRSSLM